LVDATDRANYILAELRTGAEQAADDGPAYLAVSAALLPRPGREDLTGSCARPTPAGNQDRSTAISAGLLTPGASRGPSYRQARTR
jgi:hypothetical protein